MVSSLYSYLAEIQIKLKETKIIPFLCENLLQVLGIHLKTRNIKVFLLFPSLPLRPSVQRK